MVPEQWELRPKILLLSYIKTSVYDHLGDLKAFHFPRNVKVIVLTIWHLGDVKFLSDTLRWLCRWELWCSENWFIVPDCKEWDAAAVISTTLLGLQLQPRRVFSWLELNTCSWYSHSPDRRSSNKRPRSRTCATQTWILGKAQFVLLTNLGEPFLVCFI